MTIDNVEFKQYNFQSIVDYAKEYFGCDSITGVPVENGESNSISIGSHWEKLFLPNEFMNPRSESPGVISKFTLLVLEHSGWYQVRTNR